MEPNELATGWKVTVVYYCDTGDITYDNFFATREDAIEFIDCFQPSEELERTIFLHNPDGTFETRELQGDQTKDGDYREQFT